MIGILVLGAVLAGNPGETDALEAALAGVHGAQLSISETMAGDTRLARDCGVTVVRWEPGLSNRGGPAVKTAIAIEIESPGDEPVRCFLGRKAAALRGLDCSANDGRMRCSTEAAHLHIRSLRRGLNQNQHIRELEKRIAAVREHLQALRASEEWVASVLRAWRETGVELSSLRVEGGRAQWAGTVATEEARDRLSATGQVSEVQVIPPPEPESLPLFPGAASTGHVRLHAIDAPAGALALLLAEEGKPFVLIPRAERVTGRAAGTTRAALESALDLGRRVSVTEAGSGQRVTFRMDGVATAAVLEMLGNFLKATIATPPDLPPLTIAARDVRADALVRAIAQVHGLEASREGETWFLYEKGKPRPAVVPAGPVEGALRAPFVDLTEADGWRAAATLLDSTPEALLERRDGSLAVAGRGYSRLKIQITPGSVTMTATELDHSGAKVFRTQAFPLAPQHHLR